MKRLLSIFVTIWLSTLLVAQNDVTSQRARVDYLEPKEYEIGGVTISGVQYLDHNVLLYLTGLDVGKKIAIPGEEITKAIKKLWEQGLFSDVKITMTKVINDKVFLDIYLEERPRLSRFTFEGVKKSEADDIRDLIKLIKGTQITENTILSSKKHIVDYFVEKGFLNVDVDVLQSPDTTLANSVMLTFNVKKNKRIKIHDIIFTGNNDLGTNKKWFNKYRDTKKLGDAKLRRAMKETKRKTWYNIFKSSKLIAKEFDGDKKKIIEKYNELGYRDAKIINDSVAPHDESTVDLFIDIDEGRKYYFRNITWLGNTMYSSDKLSQILGIKKGDIYNNKFLEERLLYDPAGVMSLYQDNGYLFSNVVPVEVLVEHDSIDIEMRLYEGKQAMINHVTVTGNNRTNDHVIIRELRTRPGALYKRSDVQRTIRELAQLGYFDPEKLNVDFQPNPADGTVDLEYVVEEKPSDQIELSGGWSGNFIVGTLGLAFNNFSLRNIFNGKAYRPLPSGDGQRLSLRAQVSGLWYQSYSINFVEPWFGGKKPNSLTTSVYHVVQSNNFSAAEGVKKYHYKITGAGIGMGQRLKVPDDYFTVYYELGYKHYDLLNYDYFDIYHTGQSHNLSFKALLSRHSAGPNPVFPTMGSTFSLSVELTPPYSYLNGKDYTDPTMESTERYKWIEYHKYKFSGVTFTTLAGSRDGSSRALVLMSKFEFGLLGMYNKAVGPSPFEGFEVGGDGLMGYNYYGSENIALRGYANNSLTPARGGNLYDKFTFELRYPLSLAPTATFYVIGFAEAGNCWHSAENFNPFDVKRSAGVGIRIYMPMIGMLGVDWGYGFDELEHGKGQNGSQFHFVIGQQF